MNKGGIYKIVNKFNNKYYIGSTNNFPNRWKVHKHSLNRNKHHCIALQRAWNKYGKNNFEFIVIKKVTLSFLISEEQKYLSEAKKDRKNIYNSSMIAGKPEMSAKTRKILSRIALKRYSNPKNCPFYGKHHTEDTKKILRLQKLGNKLSKLTKKKISLSLIGKNNPRYGKHLTENTKQKIINKIKDKKIYKFYNIKTKEIFTGTRYDFRKNYNLLKDSVVLLVNGTNKTLYGWTTSNIINPENVYDRPIFEFKNSLTNQIYVGTQNNFIKTFNLNRGHVSDMVNNKKNIKSVKNWYMINQIKQQSSKLL